MKQVMHKLLNNSLVFVFFAFAMVMLVRAIMGRAAPVPQVFADGYRLEQAVAQSEKEHRVVLAVATATWCGPCQMYKKGALASEAVESWVREHGVLPVFIDVDQNPDEAQMLGVSSIPATFVLRDGRVIAQRTGNTSSGKLVEWLDEKAGE